jgi:hypothetical protein
VKILHRERRWGSGEDDGGDPGDPVPRGQLAPKARDQHCPAAAAARPHCCPAARFCRAGGAWLSWAAITLLAVGEHGTLHGTRGEEPAVRMPAQVSSGGSEPHWPARGLGLPPSLHRRQALVLFRARAGSGEARLFRSCTSWRLTLRPLADALDQAGPAGQSRRVRWDRDRTGVVSHGEPLLNHSRVG